MKKIVVLSGAGISQESGIKTFRDTDGLWENHSIDEVATYEAWEKNPHLVLKFYNDRRRQLFDVQPNLAHRLLANLEKKYSIQIITQNVDDLHERAGSNKVLHLHGELKKVRSTKDPNLIYFTEKDTLWGDTCELGSHLRPHIVWFGESVPLLEEAAKMVENADHVVVVGTSLQVYPAAGLMMYASPNAKVFYIDPNPAKVNTNVHVIAESASVGVQNYIENYLSI
jgi:NAD-dependent deacetylase